MDNRKEHLICQPKNAQVENIQSEPNVTGTEEIIPKNLIQPTQQISHQNAEVLEGGSSKNISISIDSCKIGNIEHNITGENNVNISYNAIRAPLNVCQQAKIISNHFNNTSVTLEPKPSRRNPINNTELAVDTFTGRVTELNDIMQLFHQYPVVVITAMGGMGKTQLARKFASENADVYRDRYWINAETEEQLLKSFDRLARKVKVDANTDIDTVRDTYRSFNEGAALLIFDNVENVNDVYKYLPTRIQLEDVTLHMLITSRWTEWTSDSSVNCYQLQPLDISVSLQLFQRKFGETCIETMTDELVNLANMLGCLPLALQVAASCICKRTKQNSDLRAVLIAYIQQLVEGAGKLLNDPLTEYDNRSVYASMLLTLKQLENKTDDESKLALKLINAAAYMNPDVINKKCLLVSLDKGSNAYILDDALIILTEFSLFNQRIDWTDDDKCYTMHRIIQTSIRHNQTVLETADMHYTVTLKYTFAAGYIYKKLVLQHANERASAVADYYRENPSPFLLKYLILCKTINAVQAIFQIMTRDPIVSLIKQYNLLYFAVWCQDLNMTQLLYDNGGDINQPNRDVGETPLHCALWRENMEIAKWLIQAGATVSEQDRVGRTVLHRAIMNNMFEIVSDIITTDKTVVNVTDQNGNTPLHIINFYSNHEDVLSIIRVILDNDADITIVDKRGRTVLHFAAGDAHVGVVSFLLQRNKDLVNIVNENGETALHVIGNGFIPVSENNRKNIFERCKETARVLIMNGLSMNTKDKKGRTALDTVQAEFKDILLQVADECNNQSMVRPAKRQRIE